MGNDQKYDELTVICKLDSLDIDVPRRASAGVGRLLYVYLFSVVCWAIFVILQDETYMCAVFQYSNIS
jgi:hypothetical protein